MEHYDEELLELKRDLERQKHNTLETGIYVEDELVTFTQWQLPESAVHVILPAPFIVMPEFVKNVKYPSKAAPDFIVTSLDSTVNLGFNLLPVILQQEGDTKIMSRQFQNAIKNTNPSITIKEKTDSKTIKGNEMSWFEFKGFHLDGQSYNRVYLIRLRKSVLHGVFNCPLKVKNEWCDIVEKIFFRIEEEV